MRPRSFVAVAAAIAVLALAVAVPLAAAGTAKATMNENIVKTAQSNGFTTLVKAIKVAGLTKALQGKGPFTVFAPTNAAFKALPAATLAALLKNPEQLAKVLQFHVIKGKVTAAQVKNGLKASTLEGSKLTFKVKNGKVYVNGARVIKADVPASNGVIHVINKVLVPKQ
jgi:transforming growth factor-beta-induced protein